MTVTRRRAIRFGLGSAFGAGLALQGCRGVTEGAAGDVVAAGQPAALLIWAVARDRLAGWPRRPDARSLAALPAAAAGLPELGALTGGGRPAAPEAIAALRPGLVIDYGDVDAGHQDLAVRMQARLGVDWKLIDGALPRIPDAILEAGRLLDAETAAGLADTAHTIIERWRGATAGPAFYYARGADGLETGFRGALATEVLEGAGWTNVAEGSRDIGRVTREQVAVWDPEMIVTLDPAFALAAAGDRMWRWRRSGARRGILLLPATPFGWIDRPPSINRLLGCAWLADPHTGWMHLSILSQRLYGMAPAEFPRPRWMP